MYLSVLLILATINCGSSLSPHRRNSNETELNFKRLKYCLISTGVHKSYLIQRNNGKRYNELNYQWNTLNGYVTPMAYLVAHNVSDVRSAIVCCRLLNIRPVARSGGHSYLKYGFGDSMSLVIDLTKLNKVTVDPKSVSCEIGPGARTGFVNYNLWKKGKFMIPMGICPTVGIGGLSLGGGYGYFTRQLGLNIDNLIELEMVDARGDLLVINSCTNKDLFWALRGGGASFGIVTKLTYKMYSAPKYVLRGVYKYNIDEFPKFFEAWQSFTLSTLTKSISILLVFKKDIMKMEITTVNLRTRENVEDLLKEFSFPKPIYSSVKLLRYPEFLLSISQYYSNQLLTNISQLATLTKHRYVGYTKIKSIYVDQILERDDISRLQALLCDFLKSPYSTVGFEQNVGAINKFSESETSFIHRGKNLLLMQLKIYSSQHNCDNTTKLEAAEAAMKHFYEKSKVILHHRESYQNYADQDIPDYLKRYYGSNLKRLIQIKTKIDPENIFRHPQSIPVKYLM